MSLLRFALASHVAQVSGPAMLRRSLPALMTASQRQCNTPMALIPTRCARVYGPVDNLPSETSHWTQARYVSGALVPLIPVALAFPHPVLDTALCATMVLHMHWGMTGACTDYIHSDTMFKAMKISVLCLSIMSFGGLCYLNYFDMGFANAVRMLYTQL